MNNKSTENCTISEKKNSHSLHWHGSVRSVLLCEEHRVWGILSWIRRDVMKKERYPSKQHYNPVIHQQFREAKIQVVMLLPMKATRQTKENYFELLSKKLWENGKLSPDRWTDTGPATSRKAQIAVSEVLGWQHFNTAAFCVILACTKRELLASIFKTGRRPT